MATASSRSSSSTTPAATPDDEHGAQHPSAHGVFRAFLTLEGETVVGVDAVIGYLHRCHEKLAETLTYAQYPWNGLEDGLHELR